MLTLTCCGTRDEAEVFNMLQGSSKVTGIEIHHGWVSVWSDLYPHVPQSDLDERYKIDRALLFRRLISSLPRLEYLEFDFDRNLPARAVPLSITSFDSFPDVASLTLDMWPFGRLGPNSLQARFRPTVLQELYVFNSYDIDNLFEILVRSGIQLKLLLVKYTRRQRPLVHPLPLHPAVNSWHDFTQFLFQQNSLEVLVLDECDMRTNPIVNCAFKCRASLKSLDLHFHERYPKPHVPYYEEIIPSLGHEQLGFIKAVCHALEKLTIDMPLEQLVSVSPPHSLPTSCNFQVHIPYAPLKTALAASVSWRYHHHHHQ